MNSMSSASTLSASNKQTTKFKQSEWIHQRLLYDLMSSIYEFLLISSSTSSSSSTSPNQKGGFFNLSTSAESQLLQVHTCLEQIFLNGLRIKKPDKSPDLWRFIEALNWINPHMTISIGSRLSTNDSRIPPPKSARIRNDNALTWLYENLLSQQLILKLKCLLSDNEHLMNCYDVTVAFFFSKKFVEALYICLESFNRKQYSSLLQIDEKLYISVIDQSIKNAACSLSPRPQHEHINVNMCHRNKVNRETHESAKSFCDMNNDIVNMSSVLNDNLTKETDQIDVSKLKLMSGRHRKHSGRHRCKLKHSVSLKLRAWASLPEIRPHGKSESRYLIRSKSQIIGGKNNRSKLTAENLAIKDRQKVPSILLNQRKSNNKMTMPNRKCQLTCGIDDLQPINLVKCDDIKIHTDRRHNGIDRSTDKMLNAPAFKTGEGSKSHGLLKGLPAKNNVLPFINVANSPYENAEPGTSPIKKGRIVTHSAPSDFALFFASNGAKIENRYNSPFFENLDSNSASVSPLCNHDECIPTIPNRTQSLASYLQDTQRTRWNITDLERENAHLILSDAIISAIEEIKCSQMEKKNEQKKSETKKRKSHEKPRLLKCWTLGDDVDDETYKFHNCTDDDNSSYLSEITPLSNSQASSESDLSHISSNSDSTTLSNAGELKRLKTFTVSSHSINDHLAFAEWAESSIEALSAEAIALSLISKFKDYKWPRAADLLSSNAEQLSELHRTLDFGADDQNQNPYTRGTPDWAPPRFQIIFTRHPMPDRRNLIRQQNHRCAGCGMHIEPAFVNSLRYCEYSGKYHCTGCHRNQVTAIPARVLERWDFSCHPVSVFSYRLLDQIWKVPLFRVPDLNRELYAKVRSLRYCRMRRLQVKYVHDFIQTCRFADDDKAKEELDNLPVYIYDDIDNWSMNDFVNVRNGTFLKTINEIITKGEHHAFNCELCTAHRFIFSLV